MNTTTFSIAPENLSALELSRGLNEGRWTSVMLTRYFLDRIAKGNPTLHAIVSIDEGQALIDANASDRRREQGQSLSSIDGVPMTLKDAIRVKGMPSTYGMFFFKYYRPKTDCQIIQVLRESGAVFLGRSAVPTSALDWNCKNQIHPECVHPLDASRVPGGSSGGAAAALAAGLTPLEMGSDLGGSIRYPAHCCGIYGLRTTDGWWPVQDIGPEGVATAFQRLVTCGPMAKSLEDIQLLLSVFTKAFPLKNSSIGVNLHSPQVRAPQDRNRPLRIAYSFSMLGIDPDPSTKHLLERTCENLKQKGHTLVQAEPPLKAEQLFSDWGLIAGYEYSSVIPRVFRNRLSKIAYGKCILRRLGPGPLTQYCLAGMTATKTQYTAARQRHEGVLKIIDQFFQEFDLWMLPVAPSAAIPRSSCGKAISTPQGDVEYSRYLGAYTIPTTMYGTPVLTCPIGKDHDGMPIGIQIHGARYSDVNLVEQVQRLGVF